jgi:hypothetical protein
VDPDERRAETERWLRVLATDVLEHALCDGCLANAAAALEHLDAPGE